MEKDVKMITAPATKTFDEAQVECNRSRSQIDAFTRLHESDPNVVDYGFTFKTWSTRMGADGKKEQYLKKTGKVLINNERYKAMVERFKKEDQNKKERKKANRKKYAQ